MEFFETDNIEEYENFVSNHPKSHFMQSYYWGEVMRHKNFEPHTLVLKNSDGKIVASALMLKKRLLKGYCYYYVPRGFIIDYDDEKLVQIFTKCIKDYTKKNNGIFVKIDPDVKLHNLDIDGNLVDDQNKLGLIKFLEKLGYKHLGFYKEFNHEQPRFTFRLNLDRSWDEIYSGIHPTTRKILNKGNQYNLNMYIGNINDIDAFYETMLETFERENLAKTPIEYYKSFYETLNKQNMCDLYVVKVKLADLVNTYTKKVDDIKKEIETLENTEYKNMDKKKNLLNDLNNKLNKSINELEEIKKIEKEEITLSSIMTVKYGNKIWTIHGGNSTLLRELNSNYLLYLQIIKDAHDNGYKMIDFFGTSGEANPDKDNYIYGIHNFKKRLGGEYTEFIGELDLITNKLMYIAYKKLIPIYRKTNKKND